jgi:hypothetical protein
MKFRHSDISTFHYKVVLVMHSDLFEVVREGWIKNSWLMSPPQTSPIRF